MPVYNAGHRTWAEFDEIVKQFMNVSLSTPDSGIPNFLWSAFDVVGYSLAHEPFEQEFRAAHGCSAKDVVLVLASLLVRVLYRWRREKSLPRHWLRGYDGPSDRRIWLSEIELFLPTAQTIAPVGPVPSRPEVEAVFDHLSLTQAARDRIDVGLAGPHAVFLPCGEKFFADYAWITRSLYRLFHGLTRTDQNFKAPLLETAVRSQPSVLPTDESRALDGTSKQFDASFAVGETLVVVECKAKSWSLGFERGDISAVEERTRHVTEILRQIDAKAIWLASRPKGRNYDVTAFRYILPIGVSPFAEYLPSESPYWWLTEQLPRVMNPRELNVALRDGCLERIAAHHALTLPIACTPQV